MTIHRVSGVLPRLACVALLALFTAGCGKSVVEKATEAAVEANLPEGSKVDIKEDGGTVQIAGPDGQMKMETGQSVALPADFPSDIPVPDGVTWQMVQGSDKDNSKIFVAQGTVAKPMAEVSASMKEKITAQGWESEASFQQAGESEMMAYKKGDKKLSLSLSKDGDNTMVVLSNN